MMFSAGKKVSTDEPVTMAVYFPGEAADFNAHQPADSQIPLPASFLVRREHSPVSSQTTRRILPIRATSLLFAFV
jgi:hypothetical protein